jgi:hypothetical protein
VGGRDAVTSAKIRQERIDGAALFMYTDKHDIKRDLGVPGGHAAHLWAAVQQLRASGLGTTTPSSSDVGAVAATPCAAAAATTAVAAAPPPPVIKKHCMPGSETWTHAESLIVNTWMKQGNYAFERLVEVLEIQNPALQRRYDAYKASMHAGIANGNELLVFHGCAQDAIDNIAEQGFLTSFWTSATGSWQRFGPGFYFALQVNYRTLFSTHLAPFATLTKLLHAGP